MKDKPMLGISAGDPAGIGPEVTAKALAEEGVYRICRPLVVCDRAVMDDAVKFSGLTLKTRAAADPKDGVYKHGTIDVLDMDNVDSASLRHGTVSEMTGRAAFEYVRKVIELALAREIDGTVTGPIHKEAINLAGFHYAGHTEIYAELTGTADYAMMLADGDFRVVHVSTHVSLRDAIELVGKDRIVRVINLAHAALRRLGLAEPRIAVAGLNPHCGESGLFGREEIEEIVPAVEEAAKQGMIVEGPVPSDTVFSRMRGGLHDVVVAMYHDQGHIAVKSAAFTYDGKSDSWSTIAGVNMTLGLPIVRVSVDHGTAFDRAGKGTANPQSMLEAIRMAAQLS